MDRAQPLPKVTDPFLRVVNTLVTLGDRLT